MISIYTYKGLCHRYFEVGHHIITSPSLPSTTLQTTARPVQPLAPNSVSKNKSANVVPKEPLQPSSPESAAAKSFYSGSSETSRVLTPQQSRQPTTVYEHTSRVAVANDKRSQFNPVLQATHGTTIQGGREEGGRPQCTRREKEWNKTEAARYIIEYTVFHSIHVLY